MRYIISGEFIDGDNFTGEWLGVDADNLDISGALMTQVLDAVVTTIRGSGTTMIEDNQGDIYSIFPENVRRLYVTGVSE
jgi:hypothetical protein